MLKDLRLAFGVLRLPLSWGVALLAALSTFALLGLLAWGARWGVLRFQLVEWAWLEQVLAGMGALLPLVLGFFFFPSLVSSLLSLFVDPVLARLEYRYGTGSGGPSLHPASWGDQLRLSLRSFLRALGLNLMIVPFYFVPGLNIVAYGALNAHLLGRDYFYTVALRRWPPAEARDLYKTRRYRIFLDGLVIAGLFLIPGLNLLAPLIGTAFMFHRLNQKKD